MEEVRAEVIDAPAALTGADVWLAGQRERVEAIAAEFRPHEIADAKDYRESKRARAAARAAIKEVDDAKRAQTKAVKQAVRDFEVRVNELVEPLASIDAEYRAHLEEWERAQDVERLGAIAAEYEEAYPDLVDLLPFSRIVDAFGAERKWHNLSTSVQQIRRDVEGIVEQVAESERSIELSVDPSDVTEAKADFFTTLDAMGAIRRSHERVGQRRRVEELEAERRAWAEAQAAQEPEPEQEPEPTPEPARAEAAEAETEPDVPEFALVAYIDAAQREAVIGFCRANGIHGTITRTNGRRLRIEALQ